MLIHESPTSMEGHFRHYNEYTTAMWDKTDLLEVRRNRFIPHFLGFSYAICFSNLNFMAFYFKLLSLSLLKFMLVNQ